MLKEKLQQLSAAQNGLCVSISMNTHRTHPDNKQDIIMLKKLCKSADDRLMAEYKRRDIKSLRERLENIPLETDVNHNLDSLHIFLSNDTQEIIRSPWPLHEDTVHVGNNFSLRPLIKLMNRTEEFMILVLSQTDAVLYHATNDVITEEIPFSESDMLHSIREKGGDAGKADHRMEDTLNKLDKALVQLNHERGLGYVVVSTIENYNRLLHVADQPAVYFGHVPIDHSNISRHHIAAAAWELIQQLQADRRTAAVSDMLEAVGHGKVSTDLHEIYRAAKEGRADLLITHNDFSQAVRMTGDNSFELVEDSTLPGVIDDITSDIVYEVISKNGRAIFTSQDELSSLGGIALKVRY